MNEDSYIIMAWEMLKDERLKEFYRTMNRYPTDAEARLQHDQISNEMIDRKVEELKACSSQTQSTNS